MVDGLTTTDLLVENHRTLRRQGPGSDEAIERALLFLQLPDHPRIVDMGCGTGGGTLALARLVPDAHITGLDMFPEFVDRLNATAVERGLSDRVRAVVGQVEAAPFEPASLDVIWSEGVLDGAGIASVVPLWHRLLRLDGCLVFSSPTWLTAERPADLVRFWDEAGGVVGSLEENVSAVLSAGFRFIAAFALPERDWMEGYFIPREQVGDGLRRKYAGNPIAEEYFATNALEVELYRKHKGCYGYVFYLAQKC